MCFCQPAGSLYTDIKGRAMAGEQTQKPDSSAGPFHWSQEFLMFSCWDIRLSVHSKTFKSDQQCNFSDRFGSDASL